MYKAVLFDYDGTLIEFSPSNLVLIFRGKWGEEIRKGFSTLLFQFEQFTKYPIFMTYNASIRPLKLMRFIIIDLNRKNVYND